MLDWLGDCVADPGDWRFGVEDDEGPLKFGPYGWICDGVLG
jgi:hypothetical protein